MRRLLTPLLCSVLLAAAPANAQDAPREGLPDLPCIAGNCQMGVGIAASPDGLLRYEGEWKGGLPHGTGRLLRIFPEHEVLPDAEMLYGPFSLGSFRPGCRLSLGPYAESDTLSTGIPPCDDILTWALRGYHRLLEARALLPEEMAATLDRALGEAELAVADELHHAGVGGGDPEMLERARVHLRLARFKAQLTGDEELAARAEHRLELDRQDSGD